MTGWETIVAALGGLVLGVGLGALLARGPLRAMRRRELEREARLRRMVLPVLERRADALGVPPAERGADSEGTFTVVVTLAAAIGKLEEAADLPFGDTVEVARGDLEGDDPSAPPRQGEA